MSKTKSLIEKSSPDDEIRIKDLKAQMEGPMAALDALNRGTIEDAQRLVDLVAQIQSLRGSRPNEYTDHPRFMLAYIQAGHLLRLEGDKKINITSMDSPGLNDFLRAVRVRYSELIKS